MISISRLHTVPDIRLIARLKAERFSYVDRSVVLIYDPAPTCCALNLEPCSSLFTTRNEALQHALRFQTFAFSAAMPSSQMAAPVTATLSGLKVLIAGGSIGGLATAIALRAQGHSVTVWLGTRSCNSSAAKTMTTDLRTSIHSSDQWCRHHYFSQLGPGT